MPGIAKPKCPRCNSNKQVKPHGCAGDLFCCQKCGGVFDSDPDEGGEYCDRNPAARLERQERRRSSRR